MKLELAQCKWSHLLVGKLNFCSIEKKNALTFKYQALIWLLCGNNIVTYDLSGLDSNCLYKEDNAIIDIYCNMPHRTALKPFDGMQPKFLPDVVWHICDCAFEIKRILAFFWKKNRTFKPIVVQVEVEREVFSSYHQTIWGHM